MNRLAHIFPFLVVAMLIVAASCAHAQPVPVESPQSFIASLTSFWPAPPAPKTVTFTMPTAYAVQSSTDLINWQDTELKPSLTFTVSNDAPHKFFRVVRPVVLTWNHSTDSRNMVEGYQGFALGPNGEGSTFTTGYVTNCTVLLPFNPTTLYLVTVSTNGETSNLSDGALATF